MVPTLWSIISPDVRLGLAHLAFNEALKTWFCQQAWILEAGRSPCRIMLIVGEFCTADCIFKMFFIFIYVYVLIFASYVESCIWDGQPYKLGILMCIYVSVYIKITFVSVGEVNKLLPPLERKQEGGMGTCMHTCMCVHVRTHSHQVVAMVSFVCMSIPTGISPYMHWMQLVPR